MSDVRELSDDHEEPGPPGYALADTIGADTPERMRALGNPVRKLIIDLVLEHAMTVTELAERSGKAKGTIAHHVDVLVAAGLLQVVGTRQVRAVVERFYGRTARTIKIPHVDDGDLPFFGQARAEADWAVLESDTIPSGFTMRHARVPADLAAEFNDRLHDLALEFSRAPRGGDREYAVLVGLFPTNRPVGPRPKDVT